MGILSGKVAIVTGASKGLGVAEAIELAKEGASVAVLARTYDDVVKTAETIKSLGGRALPLRCDVTNRDMVREAVLETVDYFGTVDILVNNAQITSDALHPLEEWTDRGMRDTWESGPLGSWYCMVECFPYMKERGGRIINFCSPAGHGRILGFAGYSMAKEAIRSLSRCGAREWAKYGINVNVISPQAATEASDVYCDTPEKEAALLKEMGAAIMHLGDPYSDVGRSVVFLAGPDSKHITGCTLSVDGGAAML